MHDMCICMHRYHECKSVMYTHLRAFQIIHRMHIHVRSVKRRMPDITKLKSLIEWQPFTTLEDGLEKTVKYWMGRK